MDERTGTVVPQLILTTINISLRAISVRLAATAMNYSSRVLHAHEEPVRLVHTLLPGVSSCVLADCFLRQGHAASETELSRAPPREHQRR